MITQLNAFVNTHGTVYQKELILLCVNYSSKRTDYKIFTEGSSVCMCVWLNANSDSIQLRRVVSCFSFCLTVF